MRASLHFDKEVATSLFRSNFVTTPLWTDGYVEGAELSKERTFDEYRIFNGISFEESMSADGKKEDEIDDHELISCLRAESARCIKSYNEKIVERSVSVFKYQDCGGVHKNGLLKEKYMFA